MALHRRGLAVCLLASYLTILSLLSVPQGVAASEYAEASKAREEARAKKKEDNWLASILNCPLCKGKQVLACYHPCREEGGGMGECLAKCMTDNPMVLEMMLKLMPKSDPPKKADPSDDALPSVDISPDAKGLGAQHSEL